MGWCANLREVQGFRPCTTILLASSRLQPRNAPSVDRYSYKPKTVLSASPSPSSSKNNENANAKEGGRLEQDEKEDQTGTLMMIPFSGGTIEFTWHDSIGSIPATAWDSCLPSIEGSVDSIRSEADKTTEAEQEHRRSPFLEHAWLRCLEDSGCASEDTGWIPRHLSMRVHSKKRKNSSAQQPERIPTSASAQSRQPAGASIIDIDGCVPAYIKTHSKGEFIFDNAWADAAYRNGLEYYPKLLVGVPFTPVTGSRILWHSRIRDSFSQKEMNEMTLAVGDFLKQSVLTGIPLKDEGNCSSVHINFCSPDEATTLAGPLKVTPIKFNNMKTGDVASSDSTTGKASSGSNDDLDTFKTMLRRLERNGSESYLRRLSIQYHWNNQNPLRNGRPFRDFADYLSCFRSKKRITIKRERARALEDGKIRIDAIQGTDILKVEGLVDRMFEVYLSTVDKMYWGRQYLTLDFFQRLCQTSFIHNLCFMCARNVPGKEDTNMDSTTDKMKVSDVDKSIPILRAADVFAGTFNVVKDGVFYGRYWGCLPGYEVKNLHFEACYWSAIEFCIEKGLRRMEPGAGGGGT